LIRHVHFRYPPRRIAVNTDVVIAGAGPNGLMLAIELSLAGVRPIVLETLPEPSTEPKANGLVGQVVRVLDRRGLYERLSGSAQPPQPAPGFMFGALPLELGKLTDNPLYLLPVPQLRITAVLAERAAELGVQIRRGHELTGLAQDADTVTATVSGPDGTYELRSRYLVGADGGRSMTRKLSGIDFPGVSRENQLSRSVSARPPADWIDPATGALSVPGYGVVPINFHHRTDRGLFIWSQLPGGSPGFTTVEPGRATGDEPPMSLAEMAESIQRVLGVPVPLTPPEGPGPFLMRRLSGTNTRLADKFRDRRVFLVGDAAHVHSAMGGPGLNLGLQDTVNLGWKLAAAVAGRAPEGLLDSYEAERRPVAQRVVMHTQAQSALAAPGQDVTALRELVTELFSEPVVLQHIADLMSGADIRYPLGDGHPLVGRWCPDLLLHNGSGMIRLAELTRPGRPLLIDLTEDGLVSEALRDWPDRIQVITATTPGAPATALLLRPDSFVAWATSNAQPTAGELDGLRSAATRWFGAPQTVAAQ
jgi:2-polyprenyl-6-methoxyphenol hydroxylase-like FAD-dependent oxidoreductase